MIITSMIITMCREVETPRTVVPQKILKKRFQVDVETCEIFDVVVSTIEITSNQNMD